MKDRSPGAAGGLFYISKIKTVRIQLIETRL
jgi:hypothetical protein